MNTQNSNFALRKWIFITLSSFVCIAVSYYLFVGYVVLDGYRNYKKFCSEYIPSLEKYYSDKLNYPDNLSEFTKPKYSPRYKIKECGYSKTKKGFSFFVPNGLLGVAIYDSSTKKWVHD